MKKGFLLISIFATMISCRERWSLADKHSFYDACTETAKKDWAGTDSLATTYCDCIFEKMSKKYPYEEDRLANIDKLAKDTDLIKCREEVTGKK